MLTGLTYFPTTDVLPPAEAARRTEAAGFESLWVPEHTHIPASRETPYPAGGELPDEYARTLDPFVALTAAACATTTLRVGTAVCLVMERDPIVTAKEVASLDVVSGGRFELGVGAGWNREEMRNHGTEPRTRGKLLRERVEAMRAIWTEDEASYHGELVDFERIWSWPKPVQERLPVHFGGNGPSAEDRVLRYADGWMPMAFGKDDEELLARAEALRARADRPLTITFSAAPTNPRRLARLAEAGVDRVVFYVPPGDFDARVERVVSGLEAAGLR